MPVYPLLIEGAWMTRSGQTPIFQQRPGETKSSSDSHKRHDRGTRAERADGGKVAKWPFGAKRRQKDWNWREEESRSSYGKWREHGGAEGKMFSSGEVERSYRLKKAPFTEKKPSETHIISPQVFSLVTNFLKLLLRSKLFTCWGLFTNNVVQYLQCFWITFNWCFFHTTAC